MKIIIRSIKLLVFMLLIAPCNISASQSNNKNNSINNKNPLAFNAFFKKDTTKVAKGYYTIYNKDDKYYLEIPDEGMNKDVLISAQVVKGYSAFISPASGVVRFSKGRNNMLNLIRNMASETSADTADFCMMNAIRKSGLTPVSQSFPIVAYGADGKSVIIDLTSELNNSGGLFSVNSLSLLSHPDPTQSGVEKYRVIDRGAVFEVKRNQTDYQVNPNTNHGEDIVSTFLLEMVLQEIPQHNVQLKLNHLAYGFNTISISEYDTKRYASFKRDYIQRWSLDASVSDYKRQAKGVVIQPKMPICIYIDPVIPAPFVASIKKGVEAWNAPFLKAGWKNVFRFSTDEKDASLAYKKILFRWGCAYNDNSSSLLVNPANGEILSARINIMDVKADELLERYFLQCSDKDARIVKDIHSLDLRKEIMTVQVEALMANVLGIKSNPTASTTFSTSNLRSEKWLDVYGTTASVTTQFTFNYLVKPEDKISIKNLIPKISVYDNDAIAYAYGKRTTAPTLKTTYYAELDQSDPYAQSYMSNDVIEASILGISTVKKIYPQLNKLVNQLPEDQNKWELVSELTKKSLSLYHAYLLQIGNLVGGRSKRAIIPLFNEVSVTYVPKEDQIKALDYLKNNLFTSIPTWMNSDSLKMATSSFNVMAFHTNMARDILGKMLTKEVIGTLNDAEAQMGNKAFTCNDLFSYFDQVIFDGFDSNKVLSPYQRNLQACFVEKLIGVVNGNNITAGLTDESVLLHSYFVRTANKIKLLSETHTDSTCKEHFKLIMVKLNREYFDK